MPRAGRRELQLPGAVGLSRPAGRLFASTELAARVERAEVGLLAAGAAAVGRRQPALDLYVEELAGGLATWTGPGSPLNKVAGLGFAGPLDEAALARVEEQLLARGGPVRVELSTLAEPGLAALLTRRGYALAGFENVLGLDLQGWSAPPVAEGVAVTRSGDDEFATWLDTVVTGFATPDLQGVPSDESPPREALERVIGDLASAEGFSHYLARRHGGLAGGASLRLGGGVALLCGAATLPEHRRRGVQGALLTTRLAEARAAGCDLAVVTTQPGSKSQENVQRQGFDLLYARAVLVR